MIALTLFYRLFESAAFAIHPKDSIAVAQRHAYVVRIGIGGNQIGLSVPKVETAVGSFTTDDKFPEI